MMRARLESFLSFAFFLLVLYACTEPPYNAVTPLNPQCEP